MDFFKYITEQALVLIPALLVVGQIIKNIDAISDKYIPLILLPFGIVGAVGLMGLGVDSIIQGVLLTGLAVYGNQIFKQLAKDE